MTSERLSGEKLKHLAGMCCSCLPCTQSAAMARELMARRAKDSAIVRRILDLLPAENDQHSYNFRCAVKQAASEFGVNLE